MSSIKSVLVLLVVTIYLSEATFTDEHFMKKRQQALLFMDIVEKGLKHDIKNFTATGYKSEFYSEYENILAEEFSTSPQPAFISCLACRSYLTILMRDRNNGATEEELGNSATNMCGIVTDFRPEICRGSVFANVEPMVYIIDARPSLTANQICTLILQPDCGEIDPIFDFQITVNPGPPITGPKTVFTPRSPNDLKIIHVTDMHYDEDYMEGTLATCGDPVCCKRNSAVPPNPVDRAGFWGDFRNCGTPWRSIEDVLRRIRREHPDADLIYHTGDMVDHTMWENTQERKGRIMNRLFDLFREVFGTTPVFHALGNHEANPVNIFSPSVITRPSISSSWLYNLAANSWQRHGWISGNAVNTVRSHGHYTMLVRPGFRVISLNNNVCATYNFWLLYSRDDARHSLQWLHDTLLAAERANERVHLLYHLPAGGNSCIRFWSREFRRIIDRFHAIIGAQFNGHSHRDEMEIFYDAATAQHAVNVAWNAGSTTGYTNTNPNYIYYHVDPVHYQVNDKEMFMFRLTEANQTPAQSPRWFQMYSFRQEFGVTDFSIASLDRFLFNMSRDRRIIRRFWEFKVKSGDPHMANGCNDDCLRSQVCRVALNERSDRRRCEQVLAVFGTVA